MLRRRRFFEGLFLPGADIKDLTWFKLDGTEMADEQWADPEARSIAMRLAGEAIDEREAEGGRISDETLLVLLNTLPRRADVHVARGGWREDCRWELVMDTEQEALRRAQRRPPPGRRTYHWRREALALFRRSEPRSNMNAVSGKQRSPRGEPPGR